MNKVFGYARVSTGDQDLSLQLDALQAEGCDVIFKESQSGRSVEGRPELQRMLEQLRRGDKVVVWRLDRLGRSTRDLIELVQGFESQGVEFKSLQESIDTSGAMGRLVFQIFAAFAEFERNVISERTKAGLKAARARGRMGGRPAKLSQKERQRIRQLYAEDNNLTVAEIGAMFDVTRQTVYRVINEGHQGDDKGAGASAL